jgi:hypothetical protein
MATSAEQKVREAAVALKTAIAEAVSAGYRVTGIAGLDTIAISETGAVKRPDPEESKPSVSKIPSVKPFGEPSSL